MNAGTRVVITGASSGIGAAKARAWCWPRSARRAGGSSANERLAIDDPMKTAEALIDLWQVASMDIGVHSGSTPMLWPTCRHLRVIS